MHRSMQQARQGATCTEWQTSYSTIRISALPVLHVRARHVVNRSKCKASSVVLDTLTQKMFDRVDKSLQAQAGGAGGGTTYEAFLGAERAWMALRNMKTGSAAGPAPQFVVNDVDKLPQLPAYDVIMCGGTLGIFLATTLAQRGLRVLVVERGVLRGRSQEWNISRKELEELVELGLLTASECESVVRQEFNPVRVGFHGGGDVWTRDVLNLGVSPEALIATVKQKFVEAGGKVMELTALEGVKVHPDGVAIKVSSQDAAGGILHSEVTGRLLLDCMGHNSPIVRQQRWGKKPDGVCCVVGSCASGFSQNDTADVILTTKDLQQDDEQVNKLQYFWEAFPAGPPPGVLPSASCRTTYLFTYLDAEPWRPDLRMIMEDYWRMMPQYQGVQLDDLEVHRILFGFFPTYRQSPLKPVWNRVLQVGDASGVQSPLSFGGFGALTRHLARVTGALGEALEADLLDKEALGWIHAYNPGLSSAWMMQKAMSVRGKGGPAPDLINRMLSANFKAMEKLGDPVMKPFLQDVIQFGPLMVTLAQQVVGDPTMVPRLLAHVGPEAMLDWMGHAGALGMYTAFDASVGPLVNKMANSDELAPRARFQLRRLAEAWRYGSGQDYKL